MQVAGEEATRLGGAELGGRVQQQCFGVALPEAMARPGERRIPTPLKKLFLFLNGDAIEVEGLFRVAGDPAKVALIRHACDTGQDVGKVLQDLNDERSVHGAAGALKEYLRMLPEPLLTWDLYQGFVDAAALSESVGSPTAGQRRETVAALIERLPPHNRALAQHKGTKKEDTRAAHEDNSNGAATPSANATSSATGPETERFQQIVETIDESIALVQNKLLALHKQLEATDSMEEAIQIAKKIRTAKQILFHDDRKPKLGESAADQDTQKEGTASVPQTEKDEETGDNEGIVSAVASNLHPAGTEGTASGDASQLLRVDSGYESLQGIRKTMEDAHVLLDDLLPSFPQLSSYPHLSAPYAFYAVYDGHSGTEAALAAAEVVHGEIVRGAAFIAGRIEDSLREGFQAADAVILDRSARESWKNGTTAVVAFILAHTIYVANTGDSEAIMAQKQSDGAYKPVVLSHKHKPTDKEEKERIRAAGGHVVFGRLFGDLAVSRSLGDPDYKKPLSEANYISSEPHVSATPLQTEKDDFVILACDGVWDVINYQEAIDLVAAARQNSQTANGAAQTLAKRALDKGSKDNVTAVVVYLHWRAGSA